MGGERIRLIALIALFSLSLAGVAAASHRAAVQRAIQPQWNSVPYRMGSWSGTDGQFDPIYGTDPADSSLLRVYARADQAPVIAYVGFYGDLVKILEVHTPEICYPAQGWTILSSGRAPGPIYRGHAIPTNDAVVNKLGNNRLVVWWYNAGPRPIETRLRYITAELALSTLTGRKDGSMVRLETPFRDGEEGAARARMADFEKTFVPDLDGTLPR